jgi:hypothetical protein
MGRAYWQYAFKGNGKTLQKMYWSVFGRCTTSLIFGYVHSSVLSLLLLLLFVTGKDS